MSPEPGSVRPLADTHRRRPCEHPPRDPKAPTVNDGRSELIVIEPDTETNPESAGAFDDPTFVSLDFRPGAAQPVRFLHSARGLTHEDIYFFANVDGFWYPSDRDRILADLTMGIYLMPTDVDGTHALHWFDDSDEAEELGGTRVVLTARGPID